jgi:hypothetical protein
LAESRPGRKEGYVEFERDEAMGGVSKEEELPRSDWLTAGAED